MPHGSQGHYREYKISVGIAIFFVMEVYRNTQHYHRWVIKIVNAMNNGTNITSSIKGTSSAWRRSTWYIQKFSIGAERSLSVNATATTSPSSWTDSLTAWNPCQTVCYAVLGWSSGLCCAGHWARQRHPTWTAPARLLWRSDGSGFTQANEDPSWRRSCFNSLYSWPADCHCRLSNAG